MTEESCLRRKITVENEHEYTPVYEWERDADKLWLQNHDFAIFESRDKFLEYRNAERQRASEYSEPERYLPFGFCNKKWESMKASLQEGDELWEYRTPDWTWKDFVGRAGIALVRDGDIVDFLLTSMN